MSGLAVTALRLSQFRSHRRAVLEMDGRPIALHGPNGAGKTNILEAVSLLSPGRGLRRATAEEMARKPEAIGWKIRAEVAADSQHEVETGWTGGSGRTVAIDGKAAPQLALGRLVRLVWLVPAMDRLWIEGAEGRRRFLDRIVLSFDPGHGEAVLAYDRAMRQRNRLLKDMVRDASWYDALEARMAEMGAAIHEGRQAAVTRIAASQAGAATAFPAAGFRLVGPEPGAELPETEEALRTALAAGRRADLAAGRTLIGPHRSDLEAVYTDKGVLARDASTGEQKALLLSTVLANARALAEDTGAPPVLLLDEVAAHLDSGRRAALFDEICGLGAQAWMTGTGPELFTDLGDRAQHLAVVERDGVSEVQA